jgi:hypothetical protein
VSALVDGLISAIHILATSPRLNAAVRIATLEIIELYAARADAALQALKVLPTLVMQPGPGLKLRPLLTITKRTGREAGGIPANYNKGAWLRLDIRAAGTVPGPPEGYRRLEVTSAARRARADRLEQTIEAATVDGLIADAVMQSRPDLQITNTLYELLLPNELKPDLQSADNLLLLLEPETAGYPWEAQSATRASTWLKRPADTPSSSATHPPNRPRTSQGQQQKRTKSRSSSPNPATGNSSMFAP